MGRSGMIIQLEGERFTRLLVLRPASPEDRRQPGRHWECLCDCGKITVVTTGKLRSGHTKSCGCLQRDKVRTRNTTHGNSRHYLYRTWMNMVKRCTDPNDPSWPSYGGRGVTIYRKWESCFESFRDDIASHLGDRPENHTLDRVDNNQGYRIDNLRWANWTDQNRNRRTVAELQSIIERLEEENRELRAELLLIKTVV